MPRIGQPVGVDLQLDVCVRSEGIVVGQLLGDQARGRVGQALADVDPGQLFELFRRGVPQLLNLKRKL